MKLADLTYRQTEKFPQREIFGSRRKLESAAVSVPSNIAEGHAGNSTKQYLHYVSIALGSIAELETQIILASWRKCIAGNAAAEILASSDEAGTMLRGLQQSLKRRL